MSSGCGLVVACRAASSVWLQVEREGDFGEGTVAMDLLENGGSVAVTQANKQQYVDLYVEHLLMKSVSRQRTAFCRGFHKVSICSSLCQWMAGKCHPDVLAQS